MMRVFNPFESGFSIGGKILSMRRHNERTSTRSHINSRIKHIIDSRRNPQDIAMEERLIEP